MKISESAFLFMPTFSGQIMSQIQKFSDYIEFEHYFDTHHIINGPIPRNAASVADIYCQVRVICRRGCGDICET